MIQVNNVSMRFNLGREKVLSLKEFVVKKLKGQLKFEEFWALRDVSFQIEKGDTLGILGVNGSGKSTLLKVVAGVIKPTKGHVLTEGSIAPMIELGAGFDYDLTARENIYLSGAVLGFTKKYMQERYDEIVEFSEIGEFIDVPLKNYSSGMVARIAFAISTIIRPDVLIVDEILSVGDAPFQKKSSDRMKELMDAGTTVVLVSHSVDIVKGICNKCLWLDKGKMVMFGETEEVCSGYQAFCAGK